MTYEEISILIKSDDLVFLKGFLKTNYSGRLFSVCGFHMKNRAKIGTQFFNTVAAVPSKPEEIFISSL